MKPLKKIGIVLAIAIVGIFVAIAVQWRNKIQAEEMEKIAIQNLRRIDAATRQWFFEERHTSSNDVPTWADIAAYLSGSRYDEYVGGIWQHELWGTGSDFGIPKYPPSAVYTIGNMDDSPLCSYSARTLALYGLCIHVRDAANGDNENFEHFEIYQQPDQAGNLSKKKFRLSGSIVGANVAVEDKDGHWTNTVTDDEGMASVNTYQPVTIVVSKNGFLASSNFIQDGYEYNQTVLLQKKLK